MGKHGYGYQCICSSMEIRWDKNPIPIEHEDNGEFLLWKW